MANPFRTFRRYQKSALVALGIMAMLSFIVIPTWMQIQNISLHSTNVTLATSRFGKINNQRIENIRRENQLLQQFYSSANYLIQQASQQQVAMGFRNRAMILSTHSDESLVYHWLKIQEMKRQGFSISRQMVADYLRMMSDNKLTDQIYMEICQSMNISSDSVIGLLQRDILAQVFDGGYLHSVQGITPTQEFEWFCRFKQLAKIQAAAVDVTSFVHEVSEPSERELKEFFEQNKSRVQDPSLSETGFAIPRRTTVEFIEMDPSRLDTAAITPEEVQKFYDENRETLFKNVSEADSSGLGSLPNMPGTSNPFSRPMPNLNLNPLNLNRSPLTTPTPVPSAPSSSDLNLPLILTTPESSTEPSVPTDVPADISTDGPADVPAGGPTEVPAEQTPPASQEDSENSSWNTQDSPFRLVVYQTELETEAKTEDSEADMSTETEHPAENELPASVEVSQSAEPAPATEAAPATTSVTTPDTPAETTMPTAVETPPVDAASEIASPTSSITPETITPTPETTLETQPAEEKPLYQPLAEVEARIRTILARQKAVEKLQQIEERMNRFYDESIMHGNRQELTGGGAELKRLDLKALAVEAGLVYNILENVDMYKMYNADYRFSSSVVLSSQYSNRAVLDLLFDSSGLLENYPYRSISSGTEYLFWVMNTQEQTTPKFTDDGIAETVKKRWKEVEARAIAREKVRQLAEEVTKSGQSLQEYFTANPNPQIKAVVETDYFPWFEEPRLTRYEFPPLVPGEIRELGVEIGAARQQNKVIVAWGDDFMRNVFALNKGEFGTAINQPENTCYVINMLEKTPTDQELLTMFEASPFQRFYGIQYAMQVQREKIQDAIDQQIQILTDFKWLERPDAYRERMMQLNQQRRQQQERQPQYQDFGF